MENNKKLIVYFSYTGNTRMIANKIKEKLNCDILEIKTVIPYSDDYDTVVNDEQNGEASNHLPEIQEINVDLNKYVPYRFVNRKELQAIEKNIYAYPFERYDSDNERVRLYRANNSYDEMEFIAKDILRLVRDKGYRFKDISVVCRQIDAYEKISSVIFNEYEIPYYIDKNGNIIGIF